MTARSEYEKVIHDHELRILLSAERIAGRIKELAGEITKDYRGKQPILIGVLNGAFLFMADLIRRIQLDLEVDFIKISSYGDSTKSSGSVKILKDVDANVEGRHILIVEDIVDSGLSCKFLRDKFGALNPASVKYVTLLLKKESVKVDFQIDYIGFEIPNDYVVGYGLDYKQFLRNLPAIYVMDQVD